RVFPVLVRGDEESSLSLRLIGRQYVDIRRDEEAGLNYVSASLLRYLEELDEREQNAQKEASRLAAQKTRTEKRLAKQKAEEAGQASNLMDENQKRLAAQKVEEDRLADKKVKTQREAQEEAERLSAQKWQENRLRETKENAERLAAQKVEDEKLARQKEIAEQKAKEEAERLAAQKRKNEREAKEKLEADNRLRVAREKEELARKNAEIFNRSREAAIKATQTFLPKLKIPALVLVVGFVGYLLWQGITSIPLRPAPSPTPTTPATFTAVPPTKTMTPAPTETIGPTPTIPATFTAVPPTKTMTPVPTEIPTQAPTLEPVSGATMTGKKGEILVYVPAGKFTMGSDVSSDEKIHTVYLDAFWIDQFEVTNEMYAKCVADNGICAAPSNTNYFNNSSYANHPVVYVNWNMAKSYCEWAGGDLPTEAQWEKAARGKDKRAYPWGNDTPNDTLLNYTQNVGDTTKVGSYESGKSPYNAYDMAGNVWEWVNDYYQSDYYTTLGDNAFNPQGPLSGDSRVLRGGSWFGINGVTRSANRYWVDPAKSVSNVGFRCSRSP
ncbi:MAG: SUMF1/EgtB/PvdO family nonheme iron enzyme, partial [Anaerolineales bacterium]|nr:SUMF1/EgtB/PvdO family nonheme iron enzyme [Anaerolineales bacterium]